jgi:hypothetical protein
MGRTVVGAACAVILSGCAGTSASTATLTDAGSADALHEASLDTAACVEAGGQCTTSCAAIGPQSCGAGAFCCFDARCARDAADRPPPILASSYDQSCDADTDCVTVGVGDPCSCLDCANNAAINKASVAQYRTDVAESAICSCAAPPLPIPGESLCCNAGTCDLSCTAPATTSDAGSDARAADGAVAD